MKRLKLLISIFILTACVVFSVNSAFSRSGGLSIVRDHETEKLLREVTSPVLRAIDLDPDSTEIILVNDSSINAFVTAGQKIFINTGLIAESYDISTLIGVIAHEAGHIKGAHIVQKTQDYENTNIGAIAGYILGLGSVLAGAPPEAGIAISSASQNASMRNLLSHSRDYENSADTVALEVLKKINITPLGLVKLLRKLQSQQKIAGDITDKYLLTHPVTEDRINYILGFVERNPELAKPPAVELNSKFERIKAKVYGFLYPTDQTERLYKDDDSDYAKYALAVTYHRKALFDKSMKNIDYLISKYPNNPYYKELKAQFLFERGKLDQSINVYKKVVDQLNDSALIRLKLANALINKKDKKSHEEAISQLKVAMLTEPKNISVTNQLGLAYGKVGELGKSYLYFVESAILAKNYNNAKFYLKKAESFIDNSSPDFIKLTELKNELDRLLDKK